MTHQNLLTEIEKHILFIAKGLVDYPEQVRLHQKNRNGATVFIIETAPTDTGKILGKTGRTIQGLRVVCRAIAAKNGIKVEIEVAED